jgi:cytochrome oxidase Cu insertion factor (SCO1/SenC/PrrC family)
VKGIFHKASIIGALALSLLLTQPLPAQSTDAHQHHQHTTATQAEPAAAAKLTIPDVVLLDQTGGRVRFSELVQGKTVAVNFIFTTCTTICPPMGANFGQLRKLLGERAGKDVLLVSISVDPLTDTPQRMKAWGEKFDGGVGWTLVTGAKRDVDALLKAFGVFTADKWDHSPTTLIGNEAVGEWRRVNGLTAPAKLAEVINEFSTAAKQAQSADQLSPAHKYFTDVALTNQYGEQMRLYSDLLKGKVVIINVFFTSCQGSCPVMAATFAKIQDRLGERLGKDAFMISISVDPETDTPAKLKEYAERFKAKPGWFLLTGTKENVTLALQKLGQQVENRESHQNLFIIGNEPTGLWKKAFGLANSAEIIKVVESVLNDRG